MILINKRNVSISLEKAMANFSKVLAKKVVVQESSWILIQLIIETV